MWTIASTRARKSFDEAKDEIQQILARPKMGSKVREYLTKLRQEAFLEIKDGDVDTNAAQGKDTRWHEVVGLKPETTTKEEVAAHRLSGRSSSASFRMAA